MALLVKAVHLEGGRGGAHCWKGRACREESMVSMKKDFVCFRTFWGVHIGANPLSLIYRLGSQTPPCRSVVITPQTRGILRRSLSREGGVHHFYSEPNAVPHDPKKESKEKFFFLHTKRKVKKKRSSSPKRGKGRVILWSKGKEGQASTKTTFYPWEKKGSTPFRKREGRRSPRERKKTRPSQLPLHQRGETEPASN